MGARLVRFRHTSQPTLAFLLLGLVFVWGLLGLVTFHESPDLLLAAAACAVAVLSAGALWFDLLVVDPTERTVTWWHVARRRQVPFDAFDAVDIEVIARWRDGRVRTAMAPAKVDSFRVYLVGDGLRVLATNAHEDGLGARELADTLAEMMDIPVKIPS